MCTRSIDVKYYWTSDFAEFTKPFLFSSFILLFALDGIFHIMLSSSSFCKSYYSLFRKHRTTNYSPLSSFFTTRQGFVQKIARIIGKNMRDKMKMTMVVLNMDDGLGILRYIANYTLLGSWIGSSVKLNVWIQVHTFFISFTLAVDCLLLWCVASLHLT